MIRILKKEIKDFTISGGKILKIIRVDDNPIRKWYNHVCIVRVGFNYFIVLFCKILPPCGLKNFLYRMIGVTIGKNVAIANGSILDPLFPYLIKLDDNSTVGWGCKIFTHEFTQNEIRVGSVYMKKNSLAGSWSFIRAGVEIGENSIVGAMSFANKDVPNNTTVGGVPIKTLKHKK